MGVRAEVVAMYGISLNDTPDIKEFLKNYGVEEIESLKTEAEVICLDLYSGYPFILGYRMKLGETFDEYKIMWEKDFPNSEKVPEGLLEISYY